MVLSQASVTEQAMLVAFTDLTGYAQLVTPYRPPHELLTLMNAYFELVGDIIEPAGGIVVKCVGDAGLIVFPGTHLDSGVQALAHLKVQGDAWLAQQGLSSRQRIRVHHGTVATGPVGTHSVKRWDVYGEVVNVATRLPAIGMTLSPEVFQHVTPATRTLFRKHPTHEVYIQMDDPRPN